MLKASFHDVSKHRDSVFVLEIMAELGNRAAGNLGQLIESKPPVKVFVNKGDDFIQNIVVIILALFKKKGKKSIRERGKLGNAAIVMILGDDFTENF